MPGKTHHKGTEKHKADIEEILCSVPLPLIVIVLLALCCLLPVKVTAQTAQPTLSSVSPVGAQRGKTVTLTIEGINLAGADHIFFSHPGLEGKIITIKNEGQEKREQPKGSTAPPIVDIAIKYRLTAEVKIAPDTPTGRHTFRLRTSMGTSNAGTIAVGNLPDVAEAEPNSEISTAQKVSLPATASGIINTSGDQDFYAFEARAGQELVFEVVASILQSQLDSSLALLDAKGRIITSNEDFSGRPDSLLGYKFKENGTYFIRISDYLGGSGKRKFYRLNMGEMPYVTGIFPLGLQKGTTAELSVRGYNLDELRAVKVNAPDTPALWGQRVGVNINPPKGEPLNKARAAVGLYPEILETEANDDVKTAQQLTVPVTVNGRIDAAKTSGVPDQDVFKFQARKGQRLVFTIAAQRLGSLLDSVIELLDQKGQPIPRAIVQPLLETYTTLRDHDSVGSAMRLASVSGMEAEDYLMIGSELARIEELPPDPDSDTRMFNFMGRRLAFEGTTPQAHYLDTPVYKVAIYQPGKELPAGGMKPVTLTYRNDDGGMMYGKDSYLSFAAPEDGEYYLRLSDVRGLGGDDYAYRLTLAEAAPDYTLTVSPASPNVPLGGSAPITVTANRINGFDGKIDVNLEGLPAGLSATSGTILPGHFTTVLTISHPATPNQPGAISGVPLRVVGKAEINGKEVTRIADADDQISIISTAASPELIVSVEPKEIVIEPGGQAEVTVKVARANGFAGRVPVAVRNLPRNLSVAVGLNGVLITENETSRTFKITANRRAAPLEQQIYIIGKVETNSPVPSEYASTPIKIRVGRWR